MATIGSISVAFTAETASLESGIASVVNSLSGIKDAVDELKSSLGGLASATISITVDSSAVSEASKAVDDLKQKASESDAKVSVSADTSSLESAAKASEELSTSVADTGAQAVQARSSLSSLVITTAQLVVGAQQAAARYSDFRNGFLQFLETSTKIEGSGNALKAIFSGLAGDVDALKAVFGGLRAGLESAVAGFLSVENVNGLLQNSLGAVLRLFGMTDEAVRASVQALADIVTRQVSVAASHRLVQRSLQVLGSAYDEAAGALANFLTQTSSGQAIAGGLARGLDTALGVMSRFDGAIASVRSFVTSTELMGRVSAGVGSAFDAMSSRVSAAMSGLLSRASAFDTGFAGVGLRLSMIVEQAMKLVPSFAQVSSSMSGFANTLIRIAPSASNVVNVLGNLLNVANLVRVAGNEKATFFDFASTVASTVATSVALNAVGSAAYAAATGGSIMGAAWAGAGTAIAGFTAVLPTTIGLSIAAAVASGKVAEKLKQLGAEAESLGNLSDRFGQPVQEIEKLKVAADNSGVALQSVVRAQQTFSQNFSKVKVGNLGTPQAREAFGAFNTLGLTMDKLSEMKSEDAFKAVAREISKIPDAAKRTQVAMDIFGRTGPQILPLLKSVEGLDADIARLGGTISQVNFERFLAVDESFDRMNTAAKKLTESLYVPFARMQTAFNNAMAEIKGGLAPVMDAIGGVLSDISTPFAVVVEIVGRVLNTLGRLAGAALKIAAAFLSFAGIAALFEALGAAFNELWSYVEALATAMEEFATTIEEGVRPTLAFFASIGDLAVKILDGFSRLLGLGDIFIDTSKGAEGVHTNLGRIVAVLVTLGAAYVAVTSSSAIFTAVMATSAGAAVASAATTAAAWIAAGVAIAGALVVGAVVGITVYIASTLAAMATTIAACAAMHVAWLFGLGPIGLLVAGVELVGVALVGLWAMGSSVVEFFSGWGEGKEKIDAATASVDELAAAAEESQSAGNESGFLKDMESLALAAGYSQEEIDSAKQSMMEFGASIADSASSGMSSFTDAVGTGLGYSQEEIDAFKESVSETLSSIGEAVGINVEVKAESDRIEETKQAIAGARDGMAELQIRAAQFGQAGAEAAANSTKQFNELQQSLADGKITTEEFKSQSADLEKNLSKSLDAIKKGSPEETLKKNLELFKSIDDAAKQAAKSARDIGAGVQIGDKFFPRSEETKARAKQYADEYKAAADEIKKKLATGGFQQELDARAAENQRAFDAGEIDSTTFRQVKAEIDATSAQEQAQIATEEVQRELDRKNAKLKVELDFADSIRKQLEDAFLSPVEKMQKELDKVASNSELSDAEKASAEKMIRKDARENLIGKTAGEKFTERNRDIAQAQASGLINGNEAFIEAQKAANELASSLGIPVKPSSELAITQTQLAEELRKGTISAEQFAEGLKESRKKYLEALGIKENPQEADKERLGKLQEERNRGIAAERITGQFQRGEISKDEYEAAIKKNGGMGISQSEMDRGKKALENDIIGQSAADRIKEQRDRINAGMESGAIGDKARGAAALRSLDADRRSAAGIENTAGQQLQLGIDKINDAFGTTGMTMEQIQAKLSPQEFAEFQEAIKKNKESVRENLGVEKTGAEQLAESRKKLAKAVDDDVISEQEKTKILKKQRDDLLSSLGISKSPAQDFEDAVNKIKENAAELSPDEMAKGLKAAKDKLLESLGIPKSPAQAAEDAMKNLREAFVKGKISAEEFAKGAQKSKDALLQSLGIPLDPVVQLKERLKDLQEAFDKKLISKDEMTRGQEEARRSMLPGGEQESPIKKFERDVDAVNRAVSQKLISEDEGKARKERLQAQLQEDIKPALDSVAADRRLVGASDARSKGGVDTFFRILQGRDNPSLKAQLEIKKNTAILAEAAKNKDAAPVIAQLSAR